MTEVSGCSGSAATTGPLVTSTASCFVVTYFFRLAWAASSEGDLKTLKDAGVRISNPETKDPVCLNCHVEKKHKFWQGVNDFFEGGSDTSDDSKEDDDDDDDDSHFFGGGISSGGFGGGECRG